MMMKHMFTHTASIFRAVLLLGAFAFTNIQQTLAQPVSITADMPDAFETKTPVIGDGEYYFIQFYKEETYSPYLYQSFLGELGEGIQMHAMDYLPFASNRLWTLVPGSDGDHFKLKSKRGFYVYFYNNRFYTTATEANATEFSYKNRGSYRAGFKELLTSDNKQMGRWSSGGEWSDIINVGSNNQIGFVRFAKLKPTAAHIIYYRQEGVDNNDPQALTTRHYLTYSGTDEHSEWNFRSSAASSRRSIIPSDKSLWTLPTAAVYHQDGLWALEETGDDGEFFIKKHGTEEYLTPVHDSFDYLNLGEKDNVSGKYSLETPTANRYTRVQNVAQVTDPLTANMFFNWNGYGADAQKTSNDPAWVDFNVGNGALLGTEAMVAGTSWVSCTTYADLSDYDKMTINGTPDMQLRVLMSRQVDDNGPLVEKNVTIGSDGKAEVDLKNLELSSTTTGSAVVKATYINGYNNGDTDSRNIFYGEITTGNPVFCGNNKISNGNRVDLYNATWQNDTYIAYLQVDASAIRGTITKVTLKGDFKKISTNGRQMEYGVGYNSSTWSDQLTWNNADRSITTLGSTQKLPSQDGEEELSFEITDAFTSDPSNMIKTILVYNLTAGNGYIRNPRVEVEYYPSVSYAHLNAIKTGNNSPTGTINSITLTKTTGQHLHRAEGDGWQAMLWGDNGSGDWYAGFYPVEIPVSQKDDFFQVRLLVTAYGLTEQKQPIYLENMTEGMTRAVKLEDENHNIIGAAYAPTGDYQRCFRHQNLAVPSGYGKIVIRFAEPVKGTGWNINGVVNGQNGSQTYESIPEGSLYYEMDLTDTNGNPVSSIVDFTIFNWEGERNQISIAEVYFYSGTMVNNEDGGGIPSSEGFPSLWQLEQVDDYSQFRLKNPDTGRYLSGNGFMTEPNDPNGEAYEGARKAEISPNSKFWTDFSPKWYIPSKVNADKEIPVNGYVRHKESYLRQYADDQVIANQEGLRKQGLSRDIDSDWRNFNGNLDGMTQNTNHFEITHYIKKGNSTVIEFPTVLNKNNDHVYFQRFYHYDELDEGAEGNGMDLVNLKAHVSLDTRDDGNVQYFLYKNGIVTGQKLDWTYNDGTAIPDGGMARNEQRRFNFTNSDGQRFTVGVDVSRYSDLNYLNEDAHLDGDLQEPSLTMRYIFYMRDAKEMAKNLTACPEGGSKWLEAKTYHFGRTQVPYTKFKKVGYRGEFLPVRHIFSDYWVYDDPNLIDENYLTSLNLSDEELSDYLDQHLVSAVNSNTSGKIEVEVIPGNTGIRKGGYNPVLGETGLRGYGDDDPNEENYQGFYFYDLLSPSVKHEYGNSRFTVFRYPESGIVENCGLDNPAYINVYVNDGNGRRYQLAQYTLYFDAGMATRPWTEIKNGTSYANNINKVKGEERDPNKLRQKAGKPIAKVSFDFPTDMTYHFPKQGETRHNNTWGNFTPTEANNYTGTIANSSPIPLTFNHTNYSFDGDGCNWGSYALVTTKNTDWGNQKTILPADDETYGYNIDADPGMQKAFLYIDASEQPGDICAVDFEGEFCPNDQLMCSGWISGSNKIQNDDRCPGSITITMKGEDVYGNTNTIYRFCPGQIYELNNGYGDDGSGNATAAQNAAGIDGNGNNATHVVWQQFYFEFSTDQKYERYWLELNNNCVSSNGGDFFIDNVEVYTIVPEVKPQINTPLCISVKEDGTTETEMSLLRLDVDYNKLKSSANVSSGTAKLGFVFLEKETFLKTLWNRKNLSQTYEDLDAFAQAIKDGKYLLPNTDADYKAAFDAALLGDKAIWDSSTPSANMGGGIMYFQWSAGVEEGGTVVDFVDDAVQPEYSFAKAVNKQGATFRYVDDEGGRWLVFNGNYPGLDWKTNTDYYIVPTNTPITNVNDVYGIFNILSECSKATVFQVEPPYELLGLEKSKESNDYMVCEGQIPTLLTDLKGYDFNGVEIPMNDINYDWWLGKKGDGTTTPPTPGVLATLENYHAQQKDGVRLDKALATLRAHYPDVTNLDGISPLQADTEHGKPELTQPMIDYLKELVEDGQLVLHQKSISIPAEPASEDDPYFYLVACPIHDEMFNQALNPADHQYVAFFCDEPQGLRVKVGEKAPTLKTGFVPGENGFESYNYAGAGDAVLSIRLAKREQFETVKHGEPNATTIDTPETTSAETTHFLWLPVRNAFVQTKESNKVIQKSKDENIYLASTNDPVWDKNIYQAMKNGSLPVVGKIVQLNAIDVSKNSGLDENDYNRLCVYFTTNFDVREGYNYTLSLPFQESPGENTCDGTILINLKIVPDYEVWTGAAGNTDWNNDENWRRADGNLTSSTTESPDGSKRNNNELYRTDDLPSTSPLSDYMTNYTNYRTAKDRIFRKGFAPLYCTHVLIKSNEWGDAPVLYDALAGKSALEASPFPNLRDKDGWDGTVTDEDAGTVATKATSTPILRYDMQARLYNIWSDTYGSTPNKGRTGDLIAEMYQVNSCDEIAFQPTAELLNAHLLNYNNAWVEYQLDNKRWYLLGSPLQGTISGEWYAPTGTAQQKTTYYENVTFGEGYDRYSPAIYQRSWDKAKAVLYEIDSEYSTADNPDDLALNPDGSMPGAVEQGAWNGAAWNDAGADDYLDRLGYKPLGNKKANVAIKGIWSNTYNDATVDYTKGGFSVMVMNHLKGNDGSNGKSIIRLPKEDTMYDYYQFSQTGESTLPEDGQTHTELGDIQKEIDEGGLKRALNRGRLKTDLLLPTIGEGLATYLKIQRTETAASRYGDMRTYTRVPTRVGTNGLPMTLQPLTESVSAGISNLGYYLVENPFVAGLDMEKFFAGNPGLEKKYWILTPNGQQLVQRVADGDWVTPTEEVVTGEEPNQETTYHFTAANTKVAPGQGFFVQAKTAGEATTITFTADMQAQTRYGEPDEGEEFEIVVGTKQKMTTVGVTYDHDDDPETEEIPLMIDDDNDPSTPDVQATVEVPEVDNDGNPAVEDITETVTIYQYKQKTGEGYEFPLKARRTRSGRSNRLPGLVISAQRGNDKSSALVMKYEGASDDFLPKEDTETFICTEDLKQVPTVYTLCGRLATTINSIHDFTCLPLGVESDSEAPCTLTFEGVELLGDSVAFYDAVERKLTPLESGMKFKVSGQTQNRYYIVSSLNKEEVAEETHLQIFTEGRTVKVIASTAEPITNVRCFDTAGRLVLSASPQTMEYSFTLPDGGIYIIEAQTEKDRKTKKMAVK